MDESILPEFKFQYVEGHDIVTKSFRCMSWFEALDQFVIFMNGCGFRIQPGDVIINRKPIGHLLTNVIEKEVNDR